MEHREFRLPLSSGYRILQRLGSGGEGTVYLVSRQSGGELRAAKVLPDIGGSELRKLQALRKLSHRSLPRIFDLIEDGGQLWLVMEYVEGITLEQAVRRGMSRRQIYETARQLSEVLVYLHTAPTPVLHLDLKPSNILIGSGGRLVLIDFGASIRGQASPDSYAGLGTYGFAAPEQMKRGVLPDARTDIFGFGAVLYYCLFGKAPPADPKARSEGKAAQEWLGMRRIISKCLEEDPAKRWQDSRKLAGAVRRCAGAGSGREKAGYGAAMLGLVLAAALFFWQSAGEKRPAARNATAESEALQKPVLSGDIDEEERERSFARLLRTAQGLGLEEAADCYAQAAALMPADSRWYLELLDRILADGVFDREEEEMLAGLIYQLPAGESKSVLDLLTEQAEDYSLVAYRLGNAYWYYYDGSGGRGAAACWYQRSAEAGEGQDWKWLKSAGIMARISSYYSGLKQNRKADTAAYWTDLKALWAQYVEEDEELSLREQAAQELLSMLIMNASEIKETGETLEEAGRLLGELEKFQKEVGSEDGEKPVWTEELKAAKRAVRRVWKTAGGTNGETEE